MPEDITKTNLWGYLEGGLKDLLLQSRDLAAAEKIRMETGGAKYHDYAFVVFPAAKAYEGFLKKLFLDMKLINKGQYFSDHFRIGRAMSPSLPKRYRIGWVYGRLINSCQGETLPLRIWEVWKRARNRTFHYFPQHVQCVSFEEAASFVEEIMAVMEEALAGCGVKVSS